MTTIEKVKSIQDVARKNGLSLNKKFTESYLTGHSMFDGPKELGDRIVNGMWDMCVHGINNGFDGTCKSALDGLSDIVVALTELGNEQIGKLTKYSVKADGLLQKELQARKEVINVAEPLKECINTSIVAVNTMTELRSSGQGLLNVNERQFELLEQSREILNQILTAMDNIGDTSSRTAQGRSDEAIAAVKVWREDCSRNNLQSGSIAKLKKALEIVEAWAALNVGVTRKERVKEQHAFRNNDALASVVEGRASLEMLDTFLNRMATEKADISAIRAQIDERDKARQDKIDECEKGLDDIKKQKADIVAAFQNGEFDLATADRKIKSLKPKEDDLLYTVSTLRESNGPDYLKASLEQREAIYNELESVIGVLGQFKNDLVLLSDIIYGVDFNALIDMMGGRLSDKNQSIAIESIHSIIAGINDSINNLSVSGDRLKMDGLVRGRRAAIPETDRQAIIERERNSREQVSSELSPELAALLQAQGKPQQAEEQKPEVKVKRSTLFSDDDR
ncbi:MAG: hypothetical protein K2F90_03795 [Clostridiales bacterium]|nr:hypothetical protein [Clostridiales bacterium]